MLIDLIPIDITHHVLMCFGINHMLIWFFLNHVLIWIFDIIWTTFLCHTLVCSLLGLFANLKTTKIFSFFFVCFSWIFLGSFCFLLIFSSVWFLVFEWRCLFTTVTSHLYLVFYLEGKNNLFWEVGLNNSDLLYRKQIPEFHCEKC